MLWTHVGRDSVVSVSNLVAGALCAPGRRQVIMHALCVSSLFRQPCTKAVLVLSVCTPDMCVPILDHHLHMQTRVCMMLWLQVASWAGHVLSGSPNSAEAEAWPHAILGPTWHSRRLCPMKQSFAASARGCTLPRPLVFTGSCLLAIFHLPLAE